MASEYRYKEDRTTPFWMNEQSGLKNRNPDAPKDEIVHGWHRITTEDNRTYTERYATSKDITHWEDIPEDTFQADGKLYRFSIYF